MRRGQFPCGSSDFILASMTVASSSRFIGRGVELARLLAALERAEQGQPAMVLVAGDAGVGKTRLLVELAERARGRGAQVLVGGCLEVGDVGLPYVPIVAALRGFAAEADNDELVATAAKGLPGLGRLLPELADQPTAPASLGEGLEQLQLFDAVGSLLLRLSKDALVLLALEDLHWADRSTRELVAFLHQTVRIGRVLMVASYRSDELHRRHPLWPWLAELGRRPGVERLALGPLSRAELADHLAAVHAQRLSAAALERIFARSEGNPFYAEELLAAGADHAQVTLPPALAEVLLSRVQVLSDAAQQVLRAAAVAGRQVSHGLLGHTAGLREPELERGLREAVTAHLLVADAASESYAFRHALVQEALYGDLLPSERVRLHATYARLLAEAAETGGYNGLHLGIGVQAAELAYHCLASHNLAGGLAASVRAAAEAEAVLAPSEALRHLEQALALWDQVPKAAAVAGVDRVDLVLRAAEAANAAGASERAVALARQVIAEVDPSLDPLRAARARERLAHHLRAGHEEEELRLCREAVALVPEDPPTPLRARVTAALAQVLVNIGHRDEARRWCENALRVARAVASTGDEADVLITLALVEELDDRDKARSLLVEAQRRAAGSGHFDIELRALHNLGWLERDVGNLPAAWMAYDQGAERAQQVGLAWSPFGLALRGGRCFFRYEGGDWDTSETLASAVDEQVATLAPELSGDALPVEVGRGQPTVERRLATLKSLYGRHRAFDIWVAKYEAEQAIWRGELERASSAIQLGLAAVGNAARWAEAEIMLCAAGLAVQAARAEQARAASDAPVVADAIAVGRSFLHGAHSVVEPHGRSWHPNVHPRNVHLRAWLAKAEAEWTRLQGSSSPAHWQTAVEAFSFGHAYEVARCRWRLAEALLGAGEREQAAAAARAAYQTAVRLGAAPLRAALEALARRARLDLGKGVPQEPGRAGLTPRELEVLQLLVAGKSNRQIAEQLFISGKTASVHVTNILAKLGVHSRLEAAARARELGLDHLADSGRH
jgi:DNA-binding CsgD family transcriptional regulator/tetratricopeptide (TPR) repeat protein